MSEETLFHEALAKPPDERAAFLDAACAGQPQLRAAVEALLAAHEASGHPLDRPAPAPPALTGAYTPEPEQGPTVTYVPPGAEPGAVIAGRYKLLEQIGEGGMGTVWVAEQTQPVRRKVALKLIKAGMDSKTLLSRFEAERQALALMDHPNIAKVLDGGTTAAGRPFFVMEYVKGVPLTQYCDDACLTIAERLEPFVPVCQAVQHAHQKGIIHRDLKPSNVLVCLYDGQPVPKVIDFGLAKAMHQPLTEHTLYTAHGVLMGTPLYMSPEQAEFNNLDVDTRTDIYALGVILYELLTGTTPLEKKRFKEAAWQEMLRLIKEEEPPRPSARLSGSGSLPSVAAQRKSEPVKLTRLVKGELDWIVMKCLEKDRARRYETANSLARELQRYLADEVVEARPPSAGYRLRKLLRRNKGRVAAVAAMILAMTVGIGAVVAVQARANQNLAAANRQLEEANDHERQRFALALEAVGLFHGEVSKDLLLKEKQFEGLRTKLLRAAASFYEKLEGLLQDQDDSASRATLGRAYHELGGVNNSIGNKQAALAVYRKALAVRRGLAARPDASPEPVLDVARTLLEVGSVLDSMGERDEERASFEEARSVAELVEKRFGPSDSSRLGQASASSWIGSLLGQESRLEEAFVAFERAQVLQQALVDAHPSNRTYQRELASTHDDIATGLCGTGKLAEGMAEHQKALALLLAVTKADATDLEGQAALALSYANFGVKYLRAARLVEARDSLEAALAIYQRLLEANPSVSKFQNHCAFFSLSTAEVLRKMDRPAEARAVLERARGLFEQLVKANPNVAVYQAGPAWYYQEVAKLDHAIGRLDEARTECSRAVAILDKLAKKYPQFPASRVDLPISLRQRGLLEYAAGQFAPAAAANRRAIELFEGQNLWNQTLYELACCYALQARLAGKDGSGVPADAAPAEADKAMDLLRKAVAAGYQDVYDLRTDAGLDPLRQRDDFRKLLTELETKSGPKAKPKD
jgi:tetratricopeptide (TPR) repeat protein